MGDVFTIGKKFAFAADQDAAVALGKDVNVIVVDNTTGGIDATDEEVAKMADLTSRRLVTSPLSIQTSSQWSSKPLRELLPLAARAV